jgi:CRP-like cAMP-binding protein
MRRFVRRIHFALVRSEYRFPAQKGPTWLTRDAMHIRQMTLLVRWPTSAVRLSNLIRKEVPARLADLLLRLSERDEAMAGDGELRIPARYTHRLLASMVGSNREAVTRAFGVLRKAGAVEIRDRRIYVTDEVALEGLAGAVQ